MAIDSTTQQAINAVITQAMVTTFNTENGTNISVTLARQFVYFIYEDIDTLALALKESKRIAAHDYLNFKNSRAMILKIYPDANVTGYDNAIAAFEAAYPNLKPQEQP